MQNLLFKIQMAGVDGFEPSMADPKSAALPLGYTPIGSIIGIWAPPSNRESVQEAPKGLG